MNVPVPVYGAVPPFPVTVTVADPPLHKMLVELELADKGLTTLKEAL